MTTDRQDMTPAPIRIDVWRGIKALLLTLVIPVTMAVMVDITSGTLPWLTIAAAVICIPLATVVVGRTVLSEFGRVLALVAPEEIVEEAAPFAEDVVKAAEEPAGEPAQQKKRTAEPGDAKACAGADFITNDRSLDGQLLTEGAQEHHG